MSNRENRQPLDIRDNNNIINTPPENIIRRNSPRDIIINDISLTNPSGPRMHVDAFGRAMERAEELPASIRRMTPTQQAIDAFDVTRQPGMYVDAFGQTRQRAEFPRPGGPRPGGPRFPVQVVPTRGPRPGDWPEPRPAVMPVRPVAQLTQLQRDAINRIDGSSGGKKYKIKSRQKSRQKSRRKCSYK
jgi:hypothetical protein